MSEYSPPSDRSVVLVGLDGLGAFYLRPYYASGELATLMPTLCKLLAEADFATLNGRTVFPPISAPVWMTVLTGQSPDQTGIVGNEWPDNLSLPPPAPIAPSSAQPAIPESLFDLCGPRRGAAFTSWKWFQKVLPAVTATFSQTDEDDDKVISLYLSLGRGGSEAQRESEGRSSSLLPPLTFLHLDDIDETGHHTSWGSAEYKAAWSKADRRLAAVVDDVLARRLRGEEVALVVVSDHGGSEQHHGDMTPSHMEVPIIIWAGYTADEKKGDGGLDVKGAWARVHPSLVDIAPTVLALLGLPQPNYMRGSSLVHRRT